MLRAPGPGLGMLLVVVVPSCTDPNSTTGSNENEELIFLILLLLLQGRSEFAQNTVLYHYPVVSMTRLSAWSIVSLRVSLAYTGSSWTLPSLLAKVDEVKQCNMFWKPELWSGGKVISLKRWEHLQQGLIIPLAPTLRPSLRCRLITARLGGYGRFKDVEHEIATVGLI